MIAIMTQRAINLVIVLLDLILYVSFLLFDFFSMVGLIDSGSMKNLNAITIMIK